MGNLWSAPENDSTRPQLDSNRADTDTVVDTPSAIPPFTQQEPILPGPSDAVNLPPAQVATNPSWAGAPYPPYPQYTVFISHAGEDKATIAIPLREKLRAKGITAFVDEADMPAGTDAPQAMTHAMETAEIGVFVLSPEFVLKRWPMRELMCFLKRHEQCSSRENDHTGSPKIISLFYRLSVTELYREPNLKRKDENGISLCAKTRFHERRRSGEPEANIEKIKRALATLSRKMGVRNDVNANNDSSQLMSKRRELLLDEVCSEICKNVPESVRIRNPRDLTQGRNHESVPTDGFRRWFPPKLTGARAVLDFDSRNADGTPRTPEGEIKRHLLAENSGPAGIVSLCGAGGVGKSTILKALMSDDDIRTRFADGVHSIALGSDASKNALLECICYILEVSGAEKKVQNLREQNDIKRATDVFMKWFEGKRCVFFIDDVWKRSVDARALSRFLDITRVDGGNMILLTTREDEIALLTHDAEIIRLDAREARGEVARKILCFHAGVDESDEEMRDAADAISGILDICAGLPVSLAVAGKNVRKLRRKNKKENASVWARYVARLHANRHGLLQEDVGSYKRLYATLVTSLEFLDDGTEENRTGVQAKYSYKEMYRRLCVLQKQASVPNRMLMHLWETESEEDAEMIAETFAEVGLGDHRIVESETGQKLLFSLHDSVHDFAVSEARRHDVVAKAHEMLIHGYGKEHEEICTKTEDKKKVRWWSQELEDDGYIHKQLCRHLVASGRKEELCELLLTPLWAERQLEVNGIMSVEEDFRTGLQEVREDEETKEAFRLIVDAVSLSLAYVLKNKSELGFQLHGRLIECVESNKVVEKYLKSMESDWAIPRVLCVNGGVLLGAGGRNTKVIPIDGKVMCMSLFPDEERVACGCRDGRVVVVNIRRSEIEREWCAYDVDANGRSITVLSVAVLQNGTRIVTMPSRTLESGSVYVWNVESGHRVMTIGGGTDTMNCYAVSHDSSCVVCVYERGLLQMWNLRSGEMTAPSINVGDGATSIALMKDQERAIIEYCEEGKLRIWNVRTGAQLGEFGDGSWITSFTMTPDERGVVSCSEFAVTLWDLESRQEIWRSQIPSEFSNDVAVSKDGSRIAIGHEFDGIEVLRVDSEECVCDPLRGHFGEVTGVSFLGNKDSIVSCSIDGTVRVWDISRPQNETSSNLHGSALSGISFTPDGKFVVTGSSDGILQVWNAASGQAEGDPLRRHSDCVNDVATTPDGRFVVSVSDDKTVRVWNLESRKLLHKFRGYADFVNCVTVTPKGDRVVTGSSDNSVQLWDLGKMDGRHTVFEGHVDGVCSVFVSDDGLRVISVDDSNNVFVWRMETKEVLKTAVEKDAEYMSRGEVFSLIGEDTDQDEAGLNIRRWSNQIVHGKGSEARVLATLESDVWGWDISPDKKTICLGVQDSSVTFLKVDV